MPVVRVRTARPADIAPVLALQDRCYPLLSKVARWGRTHLESHQSVFRDGQMVAVDSRRVVGFSATFRISGEVALTPHTFSEITARGTFANHEPKGDALYGAEIMVHPDWRRRGIGKALYAARFDLIRRLGIRFFVAGGRIPGYVDHQDEMSPVEYVQRVQDGDLTDRVLSAQLASGLRVSGVMPNYLRDPKSLDYATLLVWENLEAGPTTANPAPAATVLRP